jgi:hypothetical protein
MGSRRCNGRTGQLPSCQKELTRPFARESLLSAPQLRTGATFPRCFPRGGRQSRAKHHPRDFIRLGRSCRSPLTDSLTRMLQSSTSAQHQHRGRSRWTSSHSSWRFAPQRDGRFAPCNARTGRRQVLRPVWLPVAWDPRTASRDRAGGRRRDDDRGHRAGRRELRCRVADSDADASGSARRAARRDRDARARDGHGLRSATDSRTAPGPGARCRAARRRGAARSRSRWRRVLCTGGDRRSRMASAASGACDRGSRRDARCRVEVGRWSREISPRVSRGSSASRCFAEPRRRACRALAARRRFRDS